MRLNTWADPDGAMVRVMLRAVEIIIATVVADAIREGALLPCRDIDQANSVSISAEKGPPIGVQKGLRLTFRAAVRSGRDGRSCSR